MSKDEISRRKYLEYAGAAIAADGAAIAGYGAYNYYGQPRFLSTPTPTLGLGAQRLTVKIGGTKPLTGTMTLGGIDEVGVWKSGRIRASTTRVK